MYRVFIAFFFIIFSAVGSAAQPNMVVIGGVRKNLGTAVEGTLLQSSFGLTNTGKENLVITGVTKPCGCIKIELNKNVIMPGETTAVNFVFNSQSYSGRVYKGFSIISNDPRQRVVLLSFVVNLFSILKASPDTIFFGTIPVGSSISRSVFLKNTSDSVMNILSVSGNNEFSKIGIGQQMLNPGDSTVITVWASFNSVGARQGEIEIATDNRAQPIKKLKFFAEIIEK